MEKPNSNASTRKFRPRVKHRKEEVIVEPVLEELVVYDLERRKCHALNETATKIWHHCDGNHTVADIAHEFQRASDITPEQAEKITWLGVNQIDKAGLLQDTPGETLDRQRGLTRRHLLQALGGVLILPVVTSLSAPTPSQAATAVVPCPIDCNLCEADNSGIYCTNAGGGGGSGCNEQPCGQNQSLCFCE